MAHTQREKDFARVNFCLNLLPSYLREIFLLVTRPQPFVPPDHISPITSHGEKKTLKRENEFWPELEM